MAELQKEISSSGSTTNIKADTRPSDYEYALMSVQVYLVDELKKVKEGKKPKLTSTSDWRVIHVHEGASAYFGAIYVNSTTKQMVVAHKGTNYLGDWIEDLRGVVLGGKSPQKIEALAITQKAIELINDKDGDYEGYHLSFTGHSLGGFLAELSLYYCPRSLNYHNHANAVTFESPGVRQTLKIFESNLEDVDLAKMDVVGYVSYPNLVNTYDKHVGSLYSVHTNLGDWGNWSGWYTKQAHSMDKMAEALAPGKELKRVYLTDWPMNLQRNEFFKQCNFKAGEYTQVKYEEFAAANQQLFQLDFTAHHHIDEQFSNNSSIALKHFSLDMQALLQAFYVYLLNSSPELKAQLKELWQSKNVPTDIMEILLSFQLVKKPSGVEMLVLTNPKLTVHHFRRRLTEWLHESGKSTLELFPAAAGLQAPHTVKIIATVLERGAVQTKDSIIYQPLVEGLSVNIPKDINDEQSKRYRDLISGIWQDLYPGIGVIKATVVEDGAEAGGLIIQPQVRGMAFNIKGAASDDKGTNDASMAQLFSMLRARDHSQPFQPAPVNPPQSSASGKEPPAPPTTGAVPK